MHEVLKNVIFNSRGCWGALSFLKQLVTAADQITALLRAALTVEAILLLTLGRPLHCGSCRFLLRLQEHFGETGLQVSELFDRLHLQARGVRRNLPRQGTFGFELTPALGPQLCGVVSPGLTAFRLKLGGGGLVVKLLEDGVRCVFVRVE